MKAALIPAGGLVHILGHALAHEQHGGVVDLRLDQPLLCRKTDLPRTLGRIGRNTGSFEQQRTVVVLRLRKTRIPRARRFRTSWRASAS